MTRVPQKQKKKLIRSKHLGLKDKTRSVFVIVLGILDNDRCCLQLAARLVATGIVVGGGVLVKVVLQLPLQRLKGGPLMLVLLPAVRHDVVNHLLTVGWAGHPVAQRDSLHHLVVAHGCMEERKDEEQKDS